MLRDGRAVAAAGLVAVANAATDLKSDAASASNYVLAPNDEPALNGLELDDGLAADVEPALDDGLAADVEPALDDGLAADDGLVADVEPVVDDGLAAVAPPTLSASTNDDSSGRRWRRQSTEWSRHAFGMAKRSSSSNLRQLQLCRPNMGRQESFWLWLVLLHCAVLVWALALLLYSLLLRSNEHLHSFVH